MNKLYSINFEELTFDFWDVYTAEVFIIYTNPTKFWFPSIFLDVFKKIRKTGSSKKNVTSQFHSCIFKGATC